MSTFVFLVCMSQQFHAWGHMKKSELPRPVVALQASTLISCRLSSQPLHDKAFLHAILNQLKSTRGCCTECLQYEYDRDS